jgi:ATP-dependent exoDNAse (exonuclease V) alpha subunit
MQFTGTDKRQGIVNGLAGLIETITPNSITVRLDGDGRRITFDPESFIDFRHGYAGTIYKGQGRTLDQTYLYHSEHWRSAASYVALTRHRDKTELFVARNPLTPRELVAVLGRASDGWVARNERSRAAFRRAAREETAPVDKSVDNTGTGRERSTAKDKATGKGKAPKRAKERVRGA